VFPDGEDYNAAALRLRKEVDRMWQRL
jgi:hypothetical protein